MAASAPTSASNSASTAELDENLLEKLRLMQTAIFDRPQVTKSDLGTGKHTQSRTGTIPKHSNVGLKPKITPERTVPSKTLDQREKKPVVNQNSVPKVTAPVINVPYQAPANYNSMSYWERKARFNYVNPNLVKENDQTEKSKGAVPKNYDNWKSMGTTTQNFQPPPNRPQFFNQRPRHQFPLRFPPVNNAPPFAWGGQPRYSGPGGQMISPNYRGCRPWQSSSYRPQSHPFPNYHNPPNFSNPGGISPEMMQTMWMKFIEEFGSRYFDRSLSMESTNNLKQTKAQKKKPAGNKNIVKNNKKEQKPKPHVPQYKELIDLEHSNDLVLNRSKFECPICMMECGAREGIVTRNCLHMFCRECISQMVQISEDVEIKCPEIGCKAVLQQREIQGLVSGPIFEKYLEISFRRIEASTPNSQHCREANCVGWCVVEGCLEKFTCPVCNKDNCIKCDVIHAPLTCEQFKTQVRQKEEDVKTQAQIQNMLDSKTTMRCPGCQILVERIEGCEAIDCTRCRMQICWATKGPRWGPAGKGDTTGGCRCRVNGIRCHPTCTNCH